MTTVSNSSPLIALARIGEIDLLRNLYGQIVIADAVRKEVVEQGHGRPGAREVSQADWITCAAPRDRTVVEELCRGGIGLGEAESIVLAQELKATLLLIDDLPARTIAERRGLPVVTTLGAILQAKSAGHIVEILPLLDRLSQARFWLDAETRKEILRRAGEGGTP